MPPPYTCLRCGFATNRKSTLRNHLSRLSPCQASLHNVSCSELIRRLDHCIDDPDSLTCDACAKTFKSYSSYKYHYVNKVCAHLPQTIHSNNTLQQQNTNFIEDIDLNVFGTESFEHIGVGMIMNTFADKRLLDATIVQYLYFNSAAPQNQNVVYVNNTTIAIYTHYGWRNRNAIDIGNYVFEFLVFKVLKSPDVLSLLQRDSQDNEDFKDFFEYWTTLIERKGRRSFECRTAVHAIIREIKENTPSARVAQIQQRVHRPV